MKRIFTLFTSLALLCLATNAFAQEYEWECVPVDGHMTGCKAPSKDNADETIGTFSRGKYIAPNGRIYGKNSIVAKTAKVVLEAQPKMARVKEVVAYSTEAMYSYYPESPLSNWFVDLLMEETEKLSGKKVDIGITNFGGIRVDMPQGDVLLDDMLSMFPFKNYLTYVEHTGKQIRKILETMASDRFQVLGGVRVVADGGKLLSAEIGGEPIDDDKIYGVATINFLLEGGDSLTLADNAVSVTVYEDIPIITAVLAHIKADTEAGRPIEYKTDGRVVVKDYKKRR
jgi:2',3'-cyclic-nucleotide 2'-phosphodiesterase (5'-nucleotidase family)